MPSNIIESSTFETNVVGPDNGDAIDAPSVRNGLQDLANRTTFLGESIQGQFTLDPVFLDGSSFQLNPTFTSGVWDENHVVQQTALAATIEGLVVYAIPAPAIPGTNAYQITQVRVGIDPAGGHGALPARLPRIRFCRVTGGALTVLHTTVDPSASVPVYEAGHEIVTAGLSEDFVDGSTYFVAFSGEQGANAVDGLVVRNARCTIQRI